MTDENTTLPSIVSLRQELLKITTSAPKIDSNYSIDECANINEESLLEAPTKTADSSNNIDINDASEPKPDSAKESVKAHNLLYAKETQSAKKQNTFPKNSIITQNLAQRLQKYLPAIFQLENTWTLVFSGERDGFSLKNLLHRTKESKSPNIVAIRDTDDAVFGAFISQPIQKHAGHFGTGECFLWRIANIDGEIEVFRATGKNQFYAMCENAFLAVGCGGGSFGLWIDEDLCKGISSRVPTFDNEPLTFGQAGDFIVGQIEVWAFE